jgi:hypothetical protein
MAGLLTDKGYQRLVLPLLLSGLSTIANGCGYQFFGLQILGATISGGSTSGWDNGWVGLPMVGAINS